MRVESDVGVNTVRSGAVSGAATAFGFAALHHALISDIWFSAVPMMFAGALCGTCLAWSYSRLFPVASARSWLAYNLSYAGLFVLLGALSFLVFDPIVTMAELLALNGPPSALIAEAFPFTVVFTLASCALLALLWGRSLHKLLAIVVTMSVLVALFGLNISVIGLVRMSRAGAYVPALFIALTALILLGNAVIFLALERNGLFACVRGLRPHEASAPAAAPSARVAAE